MIILDTNVISELMKDEPAEIVFAWFDQYQPKEIFTTSITMAEILNRLPSMADGNRKEQLSIKADLLFSVDFKGQILPFEEKSAVYFAEFSANRKIKGKPVTFPDAQIAAICKQHKAMLATRNTKDFINCGIEIENPWQYQN